MSSEPNKFLNFLDQLLPFIAVCPSWLRLWIHALIFLNFLTIAGVAIYYLHSKETAMEDQSLNRFSIDWPANNQEVPLNENATSCSRVRFRR